MTEQEVVRHVMLSKKAMLRDVAEAVGYSNVSSVSKALAGRNMFVSTWRKLLGALGQEIVVRDRSTGEEIVIDSDHMPSPLRFDMDLGFDKMLGDVE